MNRVLHVAENIKGGVATYLDIQEKYIFNDDQWESIYILPSSQVEEVSVANKIKFKGKKRPWKVFYLVLKIREYFEKDKCDILFLHSTFSGFAYVIYKIIFGMKKEEIKVLYCAHGWSSTRGKKGVNGQLSIWLDRLIINFSHVVISISKNEQSHAENVLKTTKSVHIYNGINFLEKVGEVDYKKKPEDKIKILFIGRLDDQKGFDILYKAFKDGLVDKRFTLGVIGEGVNNESLYKGTDRVNFKGWISRCEIYEHMSSYDVLIMPSRWEGFGFVALESISQGLPVVGSNVGGLPEIIENCGSVVIMDCHASIANRINEITYEKIVKWKKNIKERNLDIFSVEIFSMKIKKIYESLLSD